MNKITLNLGIIISLFGISNCILAYEASCKECSMVQLVGRGAKKAEKKQICHTTGKPLAFWHYEFSTNEGNKTRHCKVQLLPEEAKYIEAFLKGYQKNTDIDGDFITKIREKADMVIIEGHSEQNEKTLFQVLDDFDHIPGATVGNIINALLNPQGAIMGRAEEHQPWGTEGQ